MTRSPKNAAKATAWNWFSKYIRIRDAVVTTGGIEQAACITCGRILPVGKMDCGHFVPGRTMPLLLMEGNAAAQCPVCNRFRSGAWPKFESRLVGIYGRLQVEYLKGHYGQDIETTEQEFRDLAKKYREAYKAIRSKYDNA